MNDNGSFANAPVSITELRANRASDGTLWTPRDALISLLRDIDNGEIDPESILIISRHKEDEHKERRVDVTCARADTMTLIGMAEVAKHRFLSGD